MWYENRRQKMDSIYGASFWSMCHGYNTDDEAYIYIRGNTRKQWSVYVGAEASVVEPPDFACEPPA